MLKRYSFQPRWLVVAVFFLGGGFLGMLGLYLWLFNGNYFGVKKIRSIGVAQQYKFINPLLAADPVGPQNFFEDKILEQKLTRVLNQKIKSGALSSGSIYFRDIESSTFVGINEDAKFSPGIFLKIPIMLAYYKLAETTPEILDELIPDQLQKKQTVDALIRAMIINDDEKIASVLFDNIDQNSLNEVFSDLGIPFKEDSKNEDFISTKLYALFFRVLYNSTYLNRQMSEKALSILAKTNLNQGLSVGLPNNLVVAHKYHARTASKVTSEAHDCGLIYYPEHPYILCVMGFGKIKSNIDSFIGEASQMVYTSMVGKIPIKGGDSP